MVYKFFLTPAREKFADFRETSIACSSWYAEFRTFKDISIRSKDMQNFWVFFNSACLFENICFTKNYSVHSNFYTEFRSVGIFEISFTFQKISVKAFTFI